MRMIRLLQTCIIAGLPRSPVEGLQRVTEEEADRLIAANMAQDASDEVDEDDVDDDGLDSVKVADLRKLAADENIELAADANKPAILAAIRKGRADRAG